MTATVEFLTGAAENALIVPNAALRFRATPEMMAAAGVTDATGAPRTAAESLAFAARRDSMRKARAAAGGDRGRRCRLGGGAVRPGQWRCAGAQAERRVRDRPAAAVVVSPSSGTSTPNGKPAHDARPHRSHRRSEHRRS